MKVLFAVNNDSVSEAVFKKYQKDYRQIITYKNVYYFNAILKELQKDKTYDRVVVSEDLEPFANNNYDTIDKFLFDKLDAISDEATGQNTEIILVSADRRAKSDDMLVKLFGIGIYNAIVGKDRSVDEVCSLINNPRTKKDAKIYYNIETENVNYQVESENSVSEAEVQNILAHYKRIGKDEDKYVDSFNNIIAQYTDIQLKIIIKYLPMNVKAVLEARSPKYQELVMFKEKKDVKAPYTPNAIKKGEGPLVIEGVAKKEDIGFIDKKLTGSKITKPIIIPGVVSGTPATKVMPEISPIMPSVNDELNDEMKEKKIDDILESLGGLDDEEANEVKRGRGRPRKPVDPEMLNRPKRGRGRPKKEENIQETEENKPEIEELGQVQEPIVEVEIPEPEPADHQLIEPLDLFGLDDEEDLVATPNPAPIVDEPVNLFDFDEDHNDDEVPEIVEPQPIMQPETSIMDSGYVTNEDFADILSKDKKVVAFVGTTKNGTSFMVNNVAELMAGMGISTEY